MTGMLIVSIADLLYVIPDNFRAATKIIRIKLLFTRKNSAFDQRDFCDGSKMHQAGATRFLAEAELHCWCFS